MLHAIKRLRVVALTGAVLLVSTGAALAAGPSSHASTPAAVTAGAAASAPDCVAPCTKLLAPQQKVVVGASYYAFHSATVAGSATAFGAQFTVRYSEPTTRRSTRRRRPPLDSARRSACPVTTESLP